MPTVISAQGWVLSMKSHRIRANVDTAFNLNQRVKLPNYFIGFHMAGDAYGYMKRTYRYRGNEIALVKLDESGKLVKVLLSDCIVI